MAYVIYEDNLAMCAAFEKLSADPPTLGGKQLRLMKYDPTVDWPAGKTLPDVLSNYHYWYYYYYYFLKSLVNIIWREMKN